MVVSLFKGKRYRLVGLSIKNEESLKKHFPGAEIPRRKAVRELFGELK